METTQQPQTPAEIIIEAFGGVRKTARAFGIEPSSVCWWKTPKEKGGGGGIVPMDRVRQALRLAKEQGIELDAVALIGNLD